MRRIVLLFVSMTMLVGASQSSAQILHKKKVNKSTETSNSAEPDKQLYDKAMADIKHGKHEVGRLSLQTLINTYPDSEYLAKAKLAIADSYFKEGGTSNITQAINGYKDFIIFFPFLPEAAYAQMQVAMANYNEMAVADRDTTHAKAAEDEFQTFLLKYPKDPLVPQAEQRLREVQEILAEGQYRVAYYYYVKGDRRAAAGRAIPLVNRYPLYSKADAALWMLGDIFEKSERKDIAVGYYARIVKDYPLSSRAAAAKGKLKDFGMPVPQPDPQALAWMKKEQETPRPKPPVYHKPMQLFHAQPDVHMAAKTGAPVLTPDTDDNGGDVLKGPTKTTIGINKGGAGGDAPPPGSGTGVVDTVTPGEKVPEGKPAGTAASEDVNSNASSETPAGTSSSPETATSTSSAADSTKAADSAKTDSSQSTTDQKKKQKESSSKKKGLKKILPW